MAAMSFKVSCAYCSKTYTNTDIIYSTTCGHIYHFTCMQHWQTRTPSCPECRSYYPGSHKIYLNFKADDDQNDKILHLTGAVASLKTLNDELKVKLKLAESAFLQLQEQCTEKENQIKDFKMISEKRRAELQNGHAEIEDLHEQLKDAISKSLNTWYESTTTFKAIKDPQMTGQKLMTSNRNTSELKASKLQTQARVNDEHTNRSKVSEINELKARITALQDKLLSARYDMKKHLEAKGNSNNNFAPGSSKSCDGEQSYCNCNCASKKS